MALSLAKIQYFILNTKELLNKLEKESCLLNQDARRIDWVYLETGRFPRIGTLCRNLS